MSFIVGITRADGDSAIIDTLLSIFGQAYEDIEIIVVDCDARLPASPGLAQIINVDDRVALILPPAGRGSIALGLGLIAGLDMATAPYVVLCADGFVFDPNAVDLLLEGARRVDHDPRFVIVPNDLGSGEPLVSPYYEELTRFRDDVSLASLLIPRKVLDLCLPDPRAGQGTARDFVTRLSAVSAFAKIDRPVGREKHGLAQGERRGEPLACHRLRMDVFRRFRPELTGETVGALVATLASHAAERPFILVVGRIDASVSLVFDPLGEAAAFEVVMVEPEFCPHADLMALLCRAALVIVARSLHPSAANANVVALARELGARLAYYIDDNLPALKHERPDFAWYSVENLRGALSDFTAVFVTSAPLKTFYEENAIHPEVRLLSPALEEALDRAVRAPDRGAGAAAPEWRAAFFGGPFRQEFLEELVVPALETLQNHAPVGLVLPENITVETELQTYKVQAHRSFRQFILNWRRLAPKVIVHPPGRSANIDFKTANAILCSYYLGAVPIVFEERAYAGWNEDDGVVKVRHRSVEAVEEALASMISEDRRLTFFERLSAAVRRRFDGRHNLSAIADHVSGPSAVEVESRYLIAIALSANTVSKDDTASLRR